MRENEVKTSPVVQAKLAGAVTWSVRVGRWRVVFQQQRPHDVLVGDVSKAKRVGEHVVFCSLVYSQGD